MPVITAGRFAAATSVLALAVAMGGTGYAAVKIDGSQIKKNAITSKLIKNDAVTGQDVKESTLAKVPSAGTADNATNATNAGNAASVGGVKVSKINFQRPNGTAATVVFTGGGLTLTAACTAGDISLDATTSVNDASIYAIAHRDSDPGNPLEADLEGGQFDVGGTFSLLAGGTGNITFVNFEYDTTTGSVVTGQIAVDENGINTCAATGMVFAG